MPAVLLPGAVEESIKRADQEYLEKHNIKELMQTLMTQVVTLQPKDPTQYLVDVLSFDNTADAVQDKHGLSAYRQRKLLEVFKGMDKSKTGTVSFREVQAHTSRFGGSSLTETELSEIFKQFDSAQDNQITLEEFLAFFARPKMDNHDFELMCSDMLDS